MKPPWNMSEWLSLVVFFMDVSTRLVFRRSTSLRAILLMGAYSSGKARRSGTSWASANVGRTQWICGRWRPTLSDSSACFNVLVGSDTSRPPYPALVKAVLNEGSAYMRKMRSGSSAIGGKAAFNTFKRVLRLSKLCFILVGKGSRKMVLESILCYILSKTYGSLLSGK